MVSINYEIGGRQMDFEMAACSQECVFMVYCYDIWFLHIQVYMQR
jgi:hypothetical protein